MGQKWTEELERSKYGSNRIDMQVMDSLKTHEKLYTPGKCIFISGDEARRAEFASLINLDEARSYPMRICGQRML